MLSVDTRPSRQRVNNHFIPKKKQKKQQVHFWNAHIHVCTLAFINNANKNNTGYGQKTNKQKKKQLCQKEPCFTEQRSLYVSDLSKLACISFRSTHTQTTNTVNSFFLCVCVCVWTASFSTEPSVWPPFQVFRLHKLESNSSTGRAAALRATRSVESRVRVCDCHWHWVRTGHSHMCAKKRQVGVKMFGSCWGDWVTGSPWSGKTSWPALEFNVDEVFFWSFVLW